MMLGKTCMCFPGSVNLGLRASHPWLTVVIAILRSGTEVRYKSYI